jgi:hypothetical protein
MLSFEIADAIFSLHDKHTMHPTKLTCIVYNVVLYRDFSMIYLFVLKYKDIH